MQDFHHVVSAYEDHEHVYNQLKTRPGHGPHPRRRHRRVAGAAAADGRPREVRHATQIVHLFRTFISGSHGKHAWSRRKGEQRLRLPGLQLPEVGLGWAAQGQDAQARRATRGPRRTTRWAAPTPRGGAAGRPQMNEGPGRGLVPADDRHRELDVDRRRTGGSSARSRPTRAATTWPPTSSSTAPAWRPTSAEHRVLSRPARPRRRRPQPEGPPRRRAHLRVARHRQRAGAIYASGSATLGGYFPGVDTFLGLQVAAQEIADDLARRGFCQRIGPAPLDQPVAQVGPEHRRSEVRRCCPP